MSLFAIVFVCAVQAVQPDPSASLAAAKAHITADRHAEALALLAPALDATANIVDEDERRQARTALHFYSAVAASALGRDEEARAHLEEALRLAPRMRAIDATRYDARFVALFEDVRAELKGPGTFEALYPGFVSTPDSRVAFEGWEGVAVELLGSNDEKRAWRASSSPSERERVREEFWRSRDRSAKITSIDYRDAIARRIAFADATWSETGVRGAMSDRGRVFVTLGAPAAVRRRALRSDERVNAVSRGSDGITSGTVESWIYTREQLIGLAAKPTVAFRFVSHQGVGDHVLQRDGIAMNVLAAAGSGPR
jgi:GWxTD domain-containing protein